MEIEEINKTLSGLNVFFTLKSIYDINPVQPADYATATLNKIKGIIDFINPLVATQTPDGTKRSFIWVHPLFNFNFELYVFAILCKRSNKSSLIS